ncbi:MAG: cell division protein FtsZ [Promethearchaeota archaeon]
MESYIAKTKQYQKNIIPNRSKIGQANIIIVGAGGAGNNTVDRLMKIGIIGATCIAVNTDQQHLDIIKAHRRLLIGRNLTRGLGAGGQPEVGMAAAEESRSEIDALLKNADLVFITCGLGGGTGTGSAPIIAEIAKMNGAIVVGVVTLPFKTELGRINKAKEGLQNLRQFVDTLVVIDNNKLLEIAPDLPIIEAFSLADEVLATMVKGITETISLPSLINLDYADVRTILTTGGVAIVGIGESGESKANRVEDAINDALNSPLLEVDITGAKGALIHVTGGTDMSLNEAYKVGQIITRKMSKNSTVIWGARVDPNLNGYLRVMLLITGIKSPQIFGSTIPHYYNNNQSQKTLIKNLHKPKLSDEIFNLMEIPKKEN